MPTLVGVGMPYGVMACKLHATHCLPLRSYGQVGCGTHFGLAGTGLSGKALPVSSFGNGLGSRVFDGLAVVFRFFVPRCFIPRCFCPPLPPRPFTPAGVKGSLNSQFGFFGPDRGVGAGGCGAGLFIPIGERRSRSQGLNAWRGCESGIARASASERGCARSAPTSVCKVSEANEHTRYSGFLGHRPC